jgi:betaine-aldehyde dehydrogenase
MKMPGQAAQTAAIMSEIVASVPEIPAGAVNIFAESHGDGARLLVDSPRVQTVSFTGSTVVGREIAKSAAAALKRVGLELGGKTPHLVFADADLDLAIPTIVRSLTTFAGQFCMTGSRVLVESSIADKARTLLADALSSVKLGPATDPKSEMGPMIDKPNVERVNAEVEDAIAAGAKPVVRGGPSTVPGLTDGAFYHPTLLEVDDSSLPIVQHETFGPVQILQTFHSEDQAVALANDTTA